MLAGALVAGSSAAAYNLGAVQDARDEMKRKNFLGKMLHNS